MNSFYNEHLSYVAKESINFPEKYYDLTYAQKRFVCDVFDAARDEHQQVESIDEVIASLGEQMSELESLSQEMAGTVSSLESSLSKMRK
jgi:hypothetical protein